MCAVRLYILLGIHASLYTLNNLDSFAPVIGKFSYPAAVFSSSVDQSGYYVLNLNATWMATVRDGRSIMLNITIDLPYQVVCEAANLTVSGITRELTGHCGERVGKLSVCIIDEMIIIGLLF